MGIRHRVRGLLDSRQGGDIGRLLEYLIVHAADQLGIAAIDEPEWDIMLFDDLAPVVDDGIGEGHIFSGLYDFVTHEDSAFTASAGRYRVD